MRVINKTRAPHFKSVMARKRTRAVDHCLNAQRLCRAASQTEIKIARKNEQTVHCGEPKTLGLPFRTFRSENPRKPQGHLEQNAFFHGLRLKPLAHASPTWASKQVYLASADSVLVTKHETQRRKKYKSEGLYK